MGFIPETTCRRCGQKYSGLRNRCPNCGTPRQNQPNRVPHTTASATPTTAPSRRAGNHQAGAEQGGGFQSAAGSLGTVRGGLFPNRNGLGDCGRSFADFIFILIWIHHSFLLKFLL